MGFVQKNGMCWRVREGNLLWVEIACADFWITCTGVFISIFPWGPELAMCFFCSNGVKQADAMEAARSQSEPARSNLPIRKSCALGQMLCRSIYSGGIRLYSLIEGAAEIARNCQNEQHGVHGDFWKAQHVGSVWHCWQLQRPVPGWVWRNSSHTGHFAAAVLLPCDCAISPVFGHLMWKYRLTEWACQGVSVLGKRLRPGTDAEEVLQVWAAYIWKSHAHCMSTS